MSPAGAILNVRRLAALDMHGSRGTRLRRRTIFAEFRHYTRAQVWVFVPFWITVLAVAQLRRDSGSPHRSS